MPLGLMSQELILSSKEAFAVRFACEPAVVGIAPGRLEFIGNHCDYNGGRVMGVAIDRSVAVAASARSDGRIELASGEREAISLPDQAKVVKQTGPSAWANYPLGVWEMLRRQGLQLPGGFQLCVASDLPFGAGMSSSAAFELATAKALCALGGLELEKADLARLCRRAENEFVGMPCGILDQGVSAFGDIGRIVYIDCYEEAFATRPIPEDVRFWVFNTAKKHALVDSAYAERAQECARAYEILAPHYQPAFCLADILPAAVEATRGALGRDGYHRAMHVTSEHLRVIEMAKVLKEGDLHAAGQLLYASHESSRDYFENSIPELDFLVETLRRSPNVYGARLSGGGFGGAVMAMTNAAFSQVQAEAVSDTYHKRFGNHPQVIRCQSGPGARVAG